MPATRFNHTQADRIAPHLDGAIPLHEMGNGYNRANAKFSTEEIHPSLDRLLHQMGGSRSLRQHYRQGGAEVRLKKHHLQARAPVRDSHRQRIPIYLPQLQRVLRQMENSAQHVHTEKPAEQRSSRVH